VPLSLTTRQTGDIPIVVCRGRIVEGTESEALREYLDKELAQQPVLLLDLREVDFIDSSGLGLLLRAAMRVQKEGGELKLCCVSPRIQTTLKITKVHTVLKSYPSEADAIAAFSARPQARRSTPRLLRLDDGQPRRRGENADGQPSEIPRDRLVVQCSRQRRRQLA
jgi:anti-anti-sigma factor